MSLDYVTQYLSETEKIIQDIDRNSIARAIDLLSDLKRDQGRLFILGIGGSSGNASHAVNDFRKIGGIECYTPNDNVAELTARTNDEGWDTVYAPWLECSNLSDKDVVFVFSVGGGSKEKNVSVNLIHALDLAKKIGARILGVTGRDGGYTGKVADACLVIPTQSPDTITPHAEAWQAVVWHMLVTDPRIMAMSNKWESIEIK